MGLNPNLDRAIAALRTLLADDDKIAAAVLLVGLITFAAGLWMIYTPAAFLFVGACCVATSFLYLKGRTE